MVLGHTAHAAPMQLVFYPGGSFPQAHAGDAFATMRGSWNRAQAPGYEIVRIGFDQGKAQAVEPFVTGFLTDRGRTHVARPVGLAVAEDGALLMSDDANGVIYRVSCAGGMPGTVQPAVQAPSGPMMIVVEDPDSKLITPFVHWLAWNIPAGTTSLGEGLQERLTQPDGVLQGPTSRSSSGWYGPRPPMGDAPHHYHFQVLALDTMLDLPLGADRDQVLAAARGHVVARGRLVGTYRQTVAPPK